MPPARSPEDRVNILLVDGSVRFITDSVNVVTWRALGSIGGGEVTTSDSN